VATVNEELQDASIDNAVDLQQFGTGAVLAVLAILNRYDAELSAALMVALEQVPPESFTVERFEQVLGDVRRINAEAYAAAEAEIQVQLEGMAEHESNWEYALLIGLLPLAVQRRFPVQRVSAPAALSQALGQPIQGRLLDNWLKNAREGRMTTIVNAVRTGVVEGLSVSEIIQSIRGTRAAKYADGVLNRARQGLESIIKTAVTSIAEMIKDAFWTANDDLVEAVQWVSVLDGRTSHWCMARAGKLYTPVTHRPIGHEIPWLSGPGLLHFRCRSGASRVLKSWRQLGVTGLSEQDRALMDGQVPQETTYGEWLARQSAKRQEQILGKERAMLYRNGDLSFSQMFNQYGQWLTLEQLNQRIRG
jgi:hypothetical protein